MFLRRYGFLIGALITAFFLLLEIGYYLFFLDTWFDETDHVYKAWLTASGSGLPFQDFVMKYGPLGFFSQVLWQWLFGPSLLAARLLSVIFLLGLVGLIFDYLRRQGGKWLGLIGIALLAFHPYIIGKEVAGTPYSLAGFFLVLPLWIWSLNHWPLRRRIILSSIAMVAAVLVRYNLLPVLVLWWLFIWWQTGKFKNLLITLWVSLVALILLGLPYIFIDWQYALYYVVAMFGISPLPVEDSTVSFWVSWLAESRFKLVLNVFTTYYPFLVVFLSGLILLIRHYWGKVTEFRREQPELTFMMASVIVIFVTHFLFGPTYHKMYSLYFVPFLALVTALIIHLFYKPISSQSFGPVLLVAVLVLMPLSVALSGNDVIFFNRWSYSDSDLARLNRGGEYLATLVTPSDKILTLDNPDHVLAAGRLMIPERINRHDTFTDIPNKKLLSRFNRYNTEMFLGWLQQDADLFVVQAGTLYARLEPIAGQQRSPEELVAEVEAILATEYKLVGSIAGVYPRKEERGEGRLQIYRHVK